MPRGIKRVPVRVSLSLVTYQQLEKLAGRKGQTIAEYIRTLVTRHLEELGLPIYYDPAADTETGQVP